MSGNGVKMSGETAEIRIYDQIVSPFGELLGFGLSARGFSEMLAAAIEKRPKKIVVRVNSPGGSVWEGLAIYNALRRVSGVPVEVAIDGIAASVASVIALAGAHRVAGEAAMVMVHNPFAGVMGDSVEMRKAAAALEKMEESFAAVYASRTKLSKGDARAAMRETTWYTAEDALAAGFVDAIGGSTMEAEALAVVRPEALSTFAKVPGAAARFVIGGKVPVGAPADPVIRRAAACQFSDVESVLGALNGAGSAASGAVAQLECGGVEDLVETVTGGNEPEQTAKTEGETMGGVNGSVTSPGELTPAAAATAGALDAAAMERARAADILALADADQLAVAQKLIADGVDAVSAAKALKQDRDAKASAAAADHERRAKEKLDAARAGASTVPEYGSSAGAPEVPSEAGMTAGEKMEARADAYIKAHPGTSFAQAVRAVTRTDRGLAYEHFGLPVETRKRG